MWLRCLVTSAPNVVFYIAEWLLEPAVSIVLPQSYFLEISVKWCARWPLPFWGHQRIHSYDQDKTILPNKTPFTGQTP